MVAKLRLAANAAQGSLANGYIMATSVIFKMYLTFIFHCLQLTEKVFPLLHGRVPWFFLLCNDLSFWFFLVFI